MFTALHDEDEPDEPLTEPEETALDILLTIHPPLLAQSK